MPALLTPASLDSLRVLWRKPNCLSLWGIPYEMRPGQSPRDLYNAGRTEGWIWLGCPGWYHNMSETQIALAKAFEIRMREQDLLPTGSGEWQRLP